MLPNDIFRLLVMRMRMKKIKGKKMRRKMKQLNQKEGGCKAHL